MVWVGGVFKVQFKHLCQVHLSDALLRAQSSLAMNTSRDGAYTTAPGNPQLL